MTCSTNSSISDPEKLEKMKQHQIFSLTSSRFYDRSEMPVHVKFGVKKTLVGVQTVRNSVEGPDL